MDKFIAWIKRVWQRVFVALVTLAIILASVGCDEGVRSPARARREKTERDSQ